ncbi:hypothetical protein EV361DRAFT_964851 [Lentinula raphanica]|nr:hypothetical protein EV361DRAFT_964851 [Lentinula raphanica]
MIGLFFSVCGNFTDKAPLFPTLLSSPNDYHLSLLVKEKKLFDVFAHPQMLHFISKRLFGMTVAGFYHYRRSTLTGFLKQNSAYLRLPNMRLNTSIFHTVLCSGAILHAACGSPVPPSTQTGHDAALPSHHSSPVGGEPVGLSLSITSSSERLPSYEDFIEPEQLPSYEVAVAGSYTKFAALIDNHIEAGLKFFVPRELSSFIPNVHDRPIQFRYPGQRPLPASVERKTPTNHDAICGVLL